MKKCIIIIPLHTFDLKDYEIMSLKQLWSFYYNKYDDIDIGIIYPDNLDIYELEKYNINLNNIITFKTNLYWLSSPYAYNSYIVSNFLYNLVLDYEYILIHQLDSFIFKDELHYWCDKGYDYLGGFDSLLILYNHIVNLNGGFSLRKTSVFNEITKQPLVELLPLYGSCEDRLFTEYVYKDKCNIPIDDLLKFSIDIYNYAHIAFFNLLRNELPFGCHAFQKSQYVYDLCKYNINYKE